MANPHTRTGEAHVTLPLAGGGTRNPPARQIFQVVSDGENQCKVITLRAPEPGSPTTGTEYETLKVARSAEAVREDVNVRVPPREGLFSMLIHNGRASDGTVNEPTEWNARRDQIHEFSDRPASPAGDPVMAGVTVPRFNAAGGRTTIVVIGDPAALRQQLEAERHPARHLGDGLAAAVNVKQMVRHRRENTVMSKAMRQGAKNNDKIDLINARYGQVMSIAQKALNENGPLHGRRARAEAYARAEAATVDTVLVLSDRSDANSPLIEQPASGIAGLNRRSALAPPSHRGAPTLLGRWHASRVERAKIRELSHAMKLGTKKLKIVNRLHTAESHLHRSNTMPLGSRGERVVAYLAQGAQPRHRVLPHARMTTPLQDHHHRQQSRRVSREARTR